MCDDQLCMARASVKRLRRVLRRGSKGRKQLKYWLTDYIIELSKYLITSMNNQ